MITDKPRPRIVRAWRLRPIGVQETLRPLEFRGEVTIDPRTDDFFRVLIEQRKRASDNKLDDELRNTGFKVVAEFWRLWRLRGNQSRRHRSGCRANGREPCGSTGTRLHHERESARESRTLLLLSDRIARDRGRAPFAGAWIPRGNATERLASLTATQTVSSWSDRRMAASFRAMAVRSNWRTGRPAFARYPGSGSIRFAQDFESLNPYRPGSGPLLKLEDQNYAADKQTRNDLWFYGVSEKVYALFTRDQSDEPVIRKYSAHALGQYQSPIARDKERDWIVDAWRKKIRRAFGRRDAIIRLGRAASPRATHALNVVGHKTVRSEPEHSAFRLSPCRHADALAD